MESSGESGGAEAAAACALGGADRTRVRAERAVVDAEGHDAGGLDADDGVLEPVAQGLAPRRDYDGGPAHLDHARLPGRQYVVHHDAGPAGSLHVPKLFGLAHAQAAYV